MKDQITLHQDDDGNYLVDIVGLMYLLKVNELLDQSEVTAILESGEELDYLVCVDGEASYLIAQDGHDSLFELDDLTISAFYAIDVFPVDDSIRQNHDLIDYEEIHYEEALVRMKNGETVYLDFEDSEMEAVDNSHLFAPDVILNATWFTSDMVKGKKGKVGSSRKMKPMNLNNSSNDVDDIFDRLEKFLKEEEVKEKKIKKDKKSKKKPSKKKKASSKTEQDMEDLLEQMFPQDILDALEEQGFEIEIIDLDDFNPEDFEDYI